MPKPNPGETKKDFVDRCIPIVIDDGAAKNGAQAVALCNSMWEQHDKQEMARNEARSFSHVWLDASSNRRPNQYKKDVIRVGQYTHPNTKQKIDVTPARLAHWVDEFKRMRAAGINVPIGDGHPDDETGRIEPMGWIDDMYADPSGELYAIHDFPDEDCVKKARRCRGVSIGVVDEYVDCHGNVYHDVIDHIALTPTPVITGQGEFIALSRTDFDASATITTDSQTAADNQKDTPMEWLNELLGLPADADDEARKAKIKEMQDRIAAIPAEPAAAATTAESGATLSLSADAVEAMSEATTMQLDALQREGLINQGCREALQLALVGKEEARNTFCLSRKASGTDTSVAAQVIAALRQNVKAPDQTEKTGAQVPDGSTQLARANSEADQKAAKEKAEADKVKAENLRAIPATKRTEEANQWLSRYDESQKL